MHTLRQALLILLGFTLFTGCASVKVTDYSEFEPKFIPEEFFNGKLTAHGIVKNRSGEVIRYFNADLVGSWEDGVGTLDEVFTFNDGEEQTRVWTLVRGEDGKIIGTAGDVVGEAEGQIAGNAMFLDYTLRIDYKDDTIDIKIDDRMYLVNPTTLINESKMSKYGFDVGEIVLVIQKVE